MTLRTPPALITARSGFASGPDQPVGPEIPAAERPGRLAGVALMLGSGMANQAGASAGALAFPVIGPLGVVAIRQWVATTVLWATARPKPRAFTPAQWRPVLALALVYAVMNLTLYTAIDRVGLGLAVTLEFLGPLAVALAGSRRRLDAACAVVAAAAVLVLIHPAPSTDYLGIGMGLLAAVCWGCYILLNRSIGRRLPGLEGSAAAATVSALIYVPVGAAWLAFHQPTMEAVGGALAAGVLSSSVPLLADLLALRRVPAQFFGMFMSVQPVFAALAGLVILGQQLSWTSWLAIGVIVAVNTIAVRAQRPPPTPGARPGRTGCLRGRPARSSAGRAPRARRGRWRPGRPGAAPRWPGAHP
jgi:inner membrane transporter RhtA